MCSRKENSWPNQKQTCSILGEKENSTADSSEMPAFTNGYGLHYIHLPKFLWNKISLLSQKWKKSTKKSLEIFSSQFFPQPRANGRFFSVHL